MPGQTKSQLMKQVNKLAFGGGLDKILDTAAETSTIKTQMRMVVKLSRSRDPGMGTQQRNLYVRSIIPKYTYVYVA